jgi:hypothetical protein
MDFHLNVLPHSLPQLPGTGRGCWGASLKSLDEGIQHGSMQMKTCGSQFDRLCAHRGFSIQSITLPAIPQPQNRSAQGGAPYSTGAPPNSREVSLIPLQNAARFGFIASQSTVGNIRRSQYDLGFPSPARAPHPKRPCHRAPVPVRQRRMPLRVPTVQRRSL